VELELRNLYDNFRDASTIKAYAKRINDAAKKLQKPLAIMEVCGGHTHTLMKYAIAQLLPSNIHFIHGPGCPVCIMPKERIDHAYALAMQEDVILVTLGDMIKVPGSKGSLQDARARGGDVRYVYSPLDTLKIAQENPEKKVIFFAIGFETTTPMSAALLESVIAQGIENLFFHINHVTVPEAMELLLEDEACAIDAFLGPSHVSVISGSKIYEPLVLKYKKPVVVAGFEPVDVMESLWMLLQQVLENRSDLEVQYKRAVRYEGNQNAQKLIEKYFEKGSNFRFRGLGLIEKSSYRLKDEYARYDAEVIYKELLDLEPVQDHKLCLCPEILKGKALPLECSLFGTACTPSSPIGSCMVSSEGACAAYYKYGRNQDAR
jgi:hydrogenase expression/formation protein HypD